MTEQTTNKLEHSFYDMGAICRLTGLTHHVLRSWENRYAIVSPHRLTNGRRAYSPDDLKKLQTLKTLTDHGHRIGTLAKLTSEELEHRVRELGLGNGVPAIVQKKAILGVTVIGETLKSLSRNWVLDDPNYIDARYSSLDEARTDPARPVNAVIVAELPTIHENSICQIEAILRDLGGQHVLVSYRFGPHRLMAEMNVDNISFCRGIMSEDRLNAELTKLLVKGRARPTLEEAVRIRRYTNAQLAQIAALPSSIACECPRHVSSLLSVLNEFEDYSSECEDLKPGDAELHRFLNQIAGRARSLMEQAMARVIEHEQIDLE